MSKKFLKSATYSVHKLFSGSTELSYKTRYDYRKNIMAMMKTLHEDGVQISHIKHLKQRHIERLVNKWEEGNINVRTIKNRLAQIRFVCAKINKPQIIEKSNDGYLKDVPQEQSRNKAIYEFDHKNIGNTAVLFSARLQQAFGLRREESIKIIPSIADRGDILYLKPSWTKGGIERNIPIRTQEQRQLLNELHSFLQKGASLIPTEKSYYQQENTYVAEIRQAGLKNLHGLRYAYAQKRYAELTEELSNGHGWVSPYQGGITRHVMTPQQKEIDNQARLVVSTELGHSRIGITKKYIG